MANKKKHHMDHNKLELAKHLANQSKRISSQYDRFVQKIIHFIHYASTGIDRVLFNAKYAKVVSLTTDKVEDGTVNATVNRKTYELDSSTLDKSRRFASGKSNPFANTSTTDGKTTNTNSGVTESHENTENNKENNKENKEPSTGVNIFKNKSNGK